VGLQAGRLQGRDQRAFAAAALDGQDAAGAVVQVSRAAPNDVKLHHARVNAHPQLLTQELGIAHAVLEADDDRGRREHRCQRSGHLGGLAAFDGH
jgi:hypothetical protein